MKRTLIVGVLLTAIVSFAFAQAPRNDTRAAETFEIEEYEFTWTVAKSGEASIAVEKSHERTRIMLRNDSDYLWVSPANAVTIGEALAGVDEQYRKMNGSQEDRHTTVEAGRYGISYFYSTEHGFSVSIGETGRSFSSVQLNRAEAKALAPHLRKSVAMAAFADRIIDKALSPDRK